jgi:hypothetical protein
MGILIIIIACILSGVLYRLGGIGKPYNTKYRDLGCPTVGLIALLLTNGFYWADWWVYFLTFGLTFLTLTTYWDFLFHNVDNYYAHGFAIGAVGLLLCFVMPWWIPVVRLIICTLGMGIWSKKHEVDWIEEMGRGVFFIL